MKILFSPEFSGHVFMGLNEKQSAVEMDTQVCNTAGLVNELELRLGIHVEDQTDKARTVAYYKALSAYMEEHPGNILEKSFDLSGLGTAEQALRWRDNLVLDQWDTAACAKVSKRLEVLAGTEEHFDCKGLADRIVSVLHRLSDKVGENLFRDWEVVVPCEKELLHPTIIELLDALAKRGATISQMPQSSADAETNLGKVTSLLTSSESEKISLTEDDESFLIYHFPNEKAANEYLAYKGETLNADVWINSNNKAMDNWLRMMGKPTMGSRMAELQPLFLLALSVMREPLNIQNLIGWLYSPIQPFGFFGGVLAYNIIRECGYRNDKCKEVVENYIEGKSTKKDEEATEKLTDKELAKQKKDREQRVKFYLPSFEAKDKVEVDALKAYIERLSGWAKKRSHLLREEPNNESLISQLEVLTQTCDTFITLLNSSAMEQEVEWKQVDSWLSTLYKSKTTQQYDAQIGSHLLIDSPAKMAAPSKRTIWMNFVGNPAHKLDCSFLYPSEKEAIENKNSATLWDEQKETNYFQQMEMMPLLMTGKQLILVTIDSEGGEPTQKHPFIIRLNSQVENLDKFIKEPNLQEEGAEEVSVVANKITEPCINFGHADLLKWPKHLSPTTIGTLVEYPLDFMMERMLDIKSTGPGSIADTKKTMGTVAHAVIQGLFAPRGGKSRSTADEIEQRIKEEYYEQLSQSIEAHGAILNLPENKLDAERLKEQLRPCLFNLLSIIRENNLVVTGCEKEVKMNIGLIKTEEDYDMKGFIDMTLEDENHHPVVFDFKWTSSDYYSDLLKDNRSIQLELYRAMLSAEKRDAVEKVAYFLMPKGTLLSLEHFEGQQCEKLRPANNHNIVEQLKNSFRYRKEQFENGQLEAGEGFRADKIPYYNDTEDRSLFPLGIKETGRGGNKVEKQKTNIFSNYQLFKPIKED